MVDNKQQWKAWVYLAPAIALLLVFTVWPIINTVRMAFLENYNGIKAAGGAVFTFGIGNFVKVIEYRRFLQCLQNTVLLCVTTVPLSTILALLIAVALNSIKFLQKGLQTIFFLPYVTNSIAIGMVFAAMFNIVDLTGSFTNGTAAAQSWGIINNAIQLLGGDPVNWVNWGSSIGANRIVMIVYIVWNALPFKILILLGGLQGLLQRFDGMQRHRNQQGQYGGDGHGGHAQNGGVAQAGQEVLVLNNVDEVLQTDLKVGAAFGGQGAVTL